MLAVMDTDELTTQEFTVIRLPKLQVAPTTKFVPLNVTFNVCLRCPETGEMLVNVGAEPTFTVKLLVREEV